MWATLYKQYQARIQAGEDQLDLDEEFRDALGPRCLSLNCGGATPMPLVQAWLKRVFSQCWVTENYGSTEAGGITNSSEDLDGVIQDGVSVKLVDSGDYKSTDQPNPRGEILVNPT